MADLIDGGLCPEEYTNNQVAANEIRLYHSVGTSTRTHNFCGRANLVHGNWAIRYAILPSASTHAPRRRGQPGPSHAITRVQNNSVNHVAPRVQVCR